MRNAVIIIVALIAFSCVEKVIEKPENLIPKEKMVDILYDMAVFDAAKSTNKSLIDSRKVDMMKLVYKNYGIDSTSFVESDLYYASTPLVYQSIYEEVEARIELERAALEEARKQKNDSVRQKTKKKTDSLRQVQKAKSTSDTIP